MEGCEYLVFGGSTGWIGQQLMCLLKERGKVAVAATSRLEDRVGLERELGERRPKFILNAGGVTGRPNVDWCEDHKAETIRSNVIGTLNLVDVAKKIGIHVTNYSTGCLYEYDEDHPVGGRGFSEEDKPNFAGSFYAKTKGMVEELLAAYDNVLTLRLRMPISDDLHPRSFVTKITKYAKVVNVPNSMSVLPELLPISLDMTERELKGVFNFTNPGAISHNEVLQLYKEYIDPEFVWTNFTVEEQALVLKARRSNNTLDTRKLESLYHVRPIKEAMVLVFERMKQQMKK
jgi:3,5-epimerase/4-reductase